MNIHKNRTFIQVGFFTNVRYDAPLTTLGEDNHALPLFTFLIGPARSSFTTFYNHFKVFLSALRLPHGTFFNPSFRFGRKAFTRTPSPFVFSLLIQAAKDLRDAEYEISSPLLAREYTSHYQFVHRKIICEQKRDLLLYFHGL